jgi:ABC-type Na+ transport system ATPase subunit NatA
MILFSSHRFDVVEKVCSRVMILSAGRIVAERHLAELKRAEQESLEDVFLTATCQDDYAETAREILRVMQA